MSEVEAKTSTSPVTRSSAIATCSSIASLRTAIVLILLALTAATGLCANIPGGRTLDISPSDVQYCRNRNRLCALLPKGSTRYPQSIVEVDPDSLYRSAGASLARGG